VAAGLGTAPDAFLTRNRVIAAATRGTIMVEAGVRSGARNTLSHARLLGRPAMVVPGPITSAVSVGFNSNLAPGGPGEFGFQASRPNGNTALPTATCAAP
jgi:predicted Rossmann fold nucleotide-binding protein DprA/Smf involved in DNA uptake